MHAYRAVVGLRLDLGISPNLRIDFRQNRPRRGIIFISPLSYWVKKKKTSRQNIRCNRTLFYISPKRLIQSNTNRRPLSCNEMHFIKLLFNIFKRTAIDNVSFGSTISPVLKSYFPNWVEWRKRLFLCMAPSQNARDVQLIDELFPYSIVFLLNADKLLVFKKNLIQFVNKRSSINQNDSSFNDDICRNDFST